MSFIRDCENMYYDVAMELINIIIIGCTPIFFNSFAWSTRSSESQSRFVLFG